MKAAGHTAGGPSLLFARSLYIAVMVLRSSRGRPFNAPAAFIHPCQPIVASKPPSGPSWAHELKHDGHPQQLGRLMELSRLVCIGPGPARL